MDHYTLDDVIMGYYELVQELKKKYPYIYDNGKYGCISLLPPPDGQKTKHSNPQKETRKLQRAFWNFYRVKQEDKPKKLFDLQVLFTNFSTKTYSPDDDCGSISIHELSDTDDTDDYSY
jgi:hypothetical protein